MRSTRNPALKPSPGASKIKTGLGLASPSPADLARFRKWAEDIGQKRIQNIVGYKHRDAYDRAAMVLGALAEALAATGEKNRAQVLLQDYCKTRFNRHTAFRTAVRQAVQTSPPLKGMAAGL